jgi:hypothetical protein
MADTRSEVTPERDPEAAPDEAQAHLDRLSFEENFNIGQALGRIIERLDTESKRIDALKSLLESTDKKVSRLVREFGFIKKAWWIGLIAFGYVLARLSDSLPTIFSSPSI